MEVRILSANKKRNTKQQEYIQKYGDIPIDFTRRLNYMIDKYNVSESKMDEILEKRNTTICSMQYFDFKTIELLEEPEGSVRPRVRLLRANYAQYAKIDPSMVHVYVPNARDDSVYMKRIIEDELNCIDSLIYTPCDIEYNIFIKTPAVTNITDLFLSEIGLFRPPFRKPDWDNSAKKYCDMYNYNVWIDDSLVIDGSVHKYYSILPRVEIKLKYLNCVYTKRDYNNLISRRGYDGSPINYLNSKGDLV